LAFYEYAGETNPADDETALQIAEHTDWMGLGHWDQSIYVACVYRLKGLDQTHVDRLNPANVHQQSKHLVDQLSRAYLYALVENARRDAAMREYRRQVRQLADHHTFVMYHVSGSWTAEGRLGLDDREGFSLAE
jgi:hypothetical protein